MSINIKDAEEKLGEGKVEEIIEKEWKLADLPDAETLALEEHESPKARNNPNSRKNLIQYNKKTKEQKKKMVKNLQYIEKEEDVIPRDILGDYANIPAIENLMPALDVLSDRKEQVVYYNYIKMMFDDFDSEVLTFSDIDDILTLALNKVIEYRLMKIGNKNPMRVLEAGPTIEKFRKFSEKIKSGLASRRVDRIDVKNKPAFSIVDLAAHLDATDKMDFEARIVEMEKRRSDYKPPARDEQGLLINSDKDA